jgi:serine/threonine protein kinase
LVYFLSGAPKAIVLDFGLAKAYAGEGGADSTNAPTISSDGTEQGRILGTPAYMSPEQARGKQVDKRTDIWAFGCLLYELLTGRPAFRGETVSDTLARILEREPDWQAVPATLPERGLELLQRCLEKDVSNRRRDMGDVHMELEQVRTLVGKTEPVTVLAAGSLRKSSPRRLLWAAGGLAAVALAGTAVWYLRPEPPRQVMRLNMDVSPAEALTGLG